MIRGLVNMFKSEKPSVLEEASFLIDEKRRTQYGPAWVNFDRIAKLWSAYLGREVSMDDVCFMMALLKFARHADSPTMKRDNVVDAIGYLRCIERIREEMKGERLEDGN